ncbi:MAG: type II secretion system F family protein [Chlamydiae bacterium]|nr:type II secretion system F family protein [Chlamydiota bacterium]MBI3278151.1 type II secretion system F family protein [Chlamydiota bacterium]
MPIFEYTGFDVSGKKMKGLLEADHIQAVQRILFEMRIGATRIHVLEKSLSKHSPPLSEIALMTRQLALFLKTGFTLDDAFFELARGWKKDQVQKSLFLLAHRLKAGLDLEKAHEGLHLFPEFVSRALKVAESSGKIFETLEWISQDCEEKKQMINRWIESLIYPGLLFLVSLGVLFLVFQWVFPSLIELFIQQGKPLPRLTQGVLFLGHSMKWVFGFFGILVLAIYLWGPKIDLSLKRKWAKLFLRFSGLGSILKKRNACEVTRHLSFLVMSGFQIPEAFSLSARKNFLIEEELLALHRHLEEGGNLEKEDELNSIFPKGFLKMLSMGFKSGNFIEVCNRLSEYYEKELETILNRFTALLGPVLLMLVGGLIGFLVIGVLLPILQGGM